MPLSNIVPIIDLDFTNPAQSDAVTGIEWKQPGDIWLATYYPTQPEVAGLYFAKRQTAELKCTSTRGSCSNSRRIPR
jgi:hypothetical protein